MVFIAVIIIGSVSVLYLHRYQRVEISSQYSNSKTLSDWTKITQGAPQGSILGPLLFLIYINDLPTIIQPTANLIMFADDISIFTKSPDIIQLQSNLNSVIGEINEWLQNNQITLNLDKTFFYTPYKQKYREL